MLWPEGKRFAFTIVDDTDFSTVANTRPVYDLLSDLRIRTTKTVWPLRADGRAITGGHPLQRADYRKWILQLQSNGFEIGLHGVSDGSSLRSRIISGLEYFRDSMGRDPKIHTNHTGQKDAMYWGRDRFDLPFAWLYTGYRRYRTYRRHGQAEFFGGANDSTPYFWGDVCSSRIKYVRNMVFREINTLKADPLMPYRDPSRPLVPYWFSSSFGPTVKYFCELISEENQDKLLEEGGACVVYAHLGCDFTPPSPRLTYLLRRLSALPGWFVPASTLLDYVGSQRGWCNVAEHRLTFQQMQWRWMVQQCARAGGRAGSAYFDRLHSLGKSVNQCFNSADSHSSSVRTNSCRTDFSSQG